MTPLLQSFLTGQITLISLLFTALFVAIQSTNERYSIKTRTSILSYTTTKIFLIVLLLSINIDIFGILYVSGSAGRVKNYYMIIASLVGVLVLGLLYPFVQSTFSKTSPQRLLESSIKNISLKDFKPWLHSQKSYPFRPTYLFIKTEIEKRESKNAIDGIDLLYQKSRNLWEEVQKSEENLFVDGTRPNSFEPFVNDFNFRQEGADFQQIMALFEPVFDDYPHSLVKDALDKEQKEVVEEVIRQVQNFGELGIKTHERGVVELSSRFMSQLVSEHLSDRRFTSSSTSAVDESVVALGEMYWNSLSRIKIDDDGFAYRTDSPEESMDEMKRAQYKLLQERMEKVEKAAEEVGLETEPVSFSLDIETEKDEIYIQLYLSPGSDITESLTEIYKGSIIEHYSELDEKSIFDPLFNSATNAHNEYIENNERYYENNKLSTDVFIPPSRRIISREAIEFSMKWKFMQRRLGVDGSIEEMEKTWKNSTLAWPLHNFRMTLMWTTEGALLAGDYRDEMCPIGNIIGSWMEIYHQTDDLSYASHRESVLDALLVLIVIIGFLIKKQLSEYGYDIDYSTDPSEKIYNLADDEKSSRQRYQKLIAYGEGLKMAFLFVCALSEQSEMDESIDRICGNNSTVISRYSTDHPTSGIWNRSEISKSIQKYDTLRELRSLDIATELIETNLDATDESANLLLIHALRLLSTQTEDYERYQWE